MKKAFISIPILLAIVLGIAILGGGYFVWKNSTSQTVSPTATVATTTQSAVVFTVSPNADLVSAAVDFQLPSLRTQAEADLFTVDFGDGTTGSFAIQCKGGMGGPAACGGATATHTYAKAGSYSAKLISAGTVVNTETVTVASPTGTVNVPGMSKYTDTDFGFSFWYPSTWKVAPEDVSGSELGGAVVKNLQVYQPASPHPQIYYVEEVVFPSATITTPVAGCTATYSYSANNSQWMQTITSCDGAPNGPVPLDGSDTTTMGGLPSLFSQNGLSSISSIVPLNKTGRIRALVISGGQYQNSSDPLTSTIVAADPSVATPVSAAQQQATIQAEADAYKQ